MKQLKLPVSNCKSCLLSDMLWTRGKGDAVFCCHPETMEKNNRLPRKVEDPETIAEFCELGDVIDKLREAIELMIAVEEAAHHCPDCVAGAFCVKHDKAFWKFWGQAKRHLSN